MKNYAEKFIGKIVTVKVDRPLNSRHPKHGFVYELNYGFIPGTMAPDGEEVMHIFWGWLSQLMNLLVSVLRLFTE